MLKEEKEFIGHIMMRGKHNGVCCRTRIIKLARAVREDCVDAYCEAEQREGRRGLNTIVAAIRRKK